MSRRGFTMRKAAVGARLAKARLHFRLINVHITSEQFSTQIPFVTTTSNHNTLASPSKRIDRMGGDLNLKKSWHPVLMSNQRRVWEEENKALEERKKTDLRIKELKEEQKKEEIQRELEAAGSRKRVDRVDWMYQGPSSGQVGTTEEMEGYLLGKRRIDPLIKGTDHRKLEKQAAEDSFMALQHANTLRDTAAKVREDPMLAIKRQEQAAYEAMMNDPIKRRQLLAAAGQAEPERKEKRSHRHHHRRHRDNSEERAPAKKISLAREIRFAKGKKKNIFASKISIARRQEKNTLASKISIARRQEKNTLASKISIARGQKKICFAKGTDYERKTRRNTSSGDSRSSSPKRPRLYNSKKSEVVYTPNEDKEAERQRRLAAMQQDASSLDIDREKRLAAIAEQEKAQHEAEEKARARSSKYGDKGDFIHGLNRKAGNMGLADRIGRGRQGLQKDHE
ncbi:pre-mRNA-splicing factor Cwc25 [Drepanopeziza brunnea f. sp. 'multigermtubi' MB_m1]|uniref:Pre-mRNA-splicing factor Cwc25 n=1 Tax=Marssonina brunnea f. sp. multigermtubi (strain MB_m1) TaxID=1072389 RepID=K1X0V5_MARBU|nr:pre-mRNA-splicing factor Cwc25 [Drepanopeziza brunnea f. sp. 'multigermtubi' MB_m1]EKD18602.1 pre-mRNA-splicing factor Cwc25 [Drepanopeziza brunnea f. sp. 'multigermtubi' MB_m1]